MKLSYFRLLSAVSLCAAVASLPACGHAKDAAETTTTVSSGQSSVTSSPSETVSEGDKPSNANVSAQTVGNCTFGLSPIATGVATGNLSISISVAFSGKPCHLKIEAQLTLTDSVGKTLEMEGNPAKGNIEGDIAAEIPSRENIDVGHSGPVLPSTTWVWSGYCSPARSAVTAKVNIGTESQSLDLGVLQDCADGDLGSIKKGEH